MHVGGFLHLSNSETTVSPPVGTSLPHTISSGLLLVITSSEASYRFSNQTPMSRTFKSLISHSIILHFKDSGGTGEIVLIPGPKQDIQKIGAKKRSDLFPVPPRVEILHYRILFNFLTPYFVMA